MPEDKSKLTPEKLEHMFKLVKGDNLFRIFPPCTEDEIPVVFHPPVTGRLSSRETNLEPADYKETK